MNTILIVAVCLLAVAQTLRAVLAVSDFVRHGKYMAQAREEDQQKLAESEALANQRIRALIASFGMDDEKANQLLNNSADVMSLVDMDAAPTEDDQGPDGDAT